MKQRKEQKELDTNIVKVRERIKLVEVYLKANEQSWDPSKHSNHTVKELKEWIGQWKNIANNPNVEPNKNDMRGAESHSRIVMEQLSIPSPPEQKPVNKLTSAVKAGSGKLRRMTQSFASTSKPESLIESTSASAPSSPQVSNRASGVKPVKISDENISAIIIREKEVSKALQEIGGKLDTMKANVDPDLKKKFDEVRKIMDSKIQGVYKLETDNRAAKLDKNFNPETPARVIKMLDDFKEVLKNINIEVSESAKDAKLNPEVHEMVEDIFKDDNNSEAAPREAKGAQAVKEVQAADSQNNKLEERKPQALESKSSAGSTSAASEASVKGKEPEKAEPPSADEKKGGPIRVKKVGLKAQYAGNSAVPSPASSPVQNGMAQYLLRNSSSHAPTKASEKLEAAVEIKSAPRKGI